MKAIYYNSIEPEYCAAKSGFYGNHLESITGIHEWSSSRFHRHIPQESEQDKAKHIEKWKRDNDVSGELGEIEECGSVPGVGTSCIIC